MANLFGQWLTRIVDTTSEPFVHYEIHLWNCSVEEWNEHCLVVPMQFNYRSVGVLWVWFSGYLAAVICGVVSSLQWKTSLKEQC